MTSQFKVPCILDVEDVEWASLRNDIDPFGLGSKKWKVYYFFRKGQFNKTHLHSSFGRTKHEALRGLVRAINDDWLGAKRRVPVRKSLFTRFKQVHVRSFLMEAKRQSLHEVVLETEYDLKTHEIAPKLQPKKKVKKLKHLYKK